MHFGRMTVGVEALPLAKQLENGKTMLQFLFYSILTIFIATAAITLLGISKKLDIDDKYLNGLYKALLLELVAAVLFLFSQTDFFGQKSLSAVAETAPSSELSLQLMECAEVKSTLASQNPTYEQLLSELHRTNSKLARLQENAASAADYEKQLTDLERSFFVKMARLNSEIAAWGMSINFTWEPDKKRHIALKLQEAFKEIGFLEEEPNDDPLLTHDLLVRYQEVKGFGQTGYFTSQVVASILRDYLQ